MLEAQFVFGMLYAGRRETNYLERLLDLIADPDFHLLFPNEAPPPTDSASAGARTSSEEVDRRLATLQQTLVELRRQLTNPESEDSSDSEFEDGY